MLTTVRRNVLVFKEPVDMRKSFDGLSGLLQGQNLLSGDVFLFGGRDRRRAKAMFWAGTGLNIWMKRWSRGSSPTCGHAKGSRRASSSSSSKTEVLKILPPEEVAAQVINLFSRT